MLIEFGGRFPWVRRHQCAQPQKFALPPAEVSFHQTWVKTDQGLGWLHHHEANGYIVQLQDGRLIQRTPDQFTHVEEPTQ